MVRHALWSLNFLRCAKFFVNNSWKLSLSHSGKFQQALNQNPKRVSLIYLVREWLLLIIRGDKSFFFEIFLILLSLKCVALYGLARPNAISPLIANNLKTWISKNLLGKLETTLIYSRRFLIKIESKKETGSWWRPKCLNSVPRIFFRENQNKEKTFLKSFFIKKVSCNASS